VGIVTPRHEEAFRRNAEPVRLADDEHVEGTVGDGVIGEDGDVRLG
jgi:hypothetical protein